MPASLVSSNTDGDVFTLAPIRDIFRRYRSILIFGSVGVLILGVVLVGIVWWITPVTRVSSIQISFDFLGAQDGKYPNDLPFSPEELLGPSVLRTVYDRHQLGQWIEYPAFVSALAIIQSPGALDDIRKAYSAKLSDGKLSGPDRRALEKEYLSRLRSAASTFHNLVWHESRGLSPQVPPEVQAKVLADIPAVWMDQAVRQKQVGLFASRMPGLNPSLSSGAGTELEGLATLQAQARALEDGLASIEKLPGSFQVALSDGTTLSDLKLRLRAYREQVLPGLQAALLEGIKSGEELNALARALELQLKFRSNRAALVRQRVTGLVDTYRDYLAGRPGAGGLSHSGEPVAASVGPDEALLNRLLGLAQAGSDRDILRKMLGEIEAARILEARYELSVLEVQQDLETIRLALPRPVGPGSAGLPLQPPPPAQDRAPSASQAQLQDAAGRLGRLLDAARQLTTRISAEYLGSQPELFRVTRGFQVAEIRAMGLPRLGMTLVAWTVLASFCIVVLILLHQRASSLGRNLRRP